MKHNSIYIFISILFVFFVSSCSEDFLDAEYTGGIDGETATELAESDPTALEGYLNGIYKHMVSMGSDSHDDFGFMSVLHANDLMGQDMVQSVSHWFTYDYGHENRNYNYRRTASMWRIFYTMIAKSNEVINFFPEEPTSVDSKGMLGQAYAIRGFAYYYLVQLYQNTYAGIPANLDLPAIPMRYASVETELSDEEKLARTGRNTVDLVFQQIEADLKYSIELLDAGYQRPAKYFIDASVAHGMIARYYLLRQNWDAAVEHARIARANYPVMDKSDLHDGFMDLSNGEWMWGFDHNTETQTTYASFFSHISNITPGYAGIGYAPRMIDASLYDFISDTDERKLLFCGPEGPNAAIGQEEMTESSIANQPYANRKFGDDGTWTMDYVYMRSSEMVLIEAEALAELGKKADAANVLNMLMSKRDSEWNKETVEASDVHLQRRIELWGEGFEYYDLKRLHKDMSREYEGSNHRTGSVFSVPADDKRWIYQLPLGEINENDLITMENNNE